MLLLDRERVEDGSDGLDEHCLEAFLGLGRALKVLDGTDRLAEGATLEQEQVAHILGADDDSLHIVEHVPGLP